MVLAPLARQIEREGGDVVGHHLTGGDVDDRRHGDASVIVRKPGEIRLAQALVAEHGVAATGIEVERPAALVVGRPADAHRHHSFQPEQAAHDDRPVRPRAGSGDDEAVAARFHLPLAAAVGGDPIGDVVGIALERAALLDVGGHRPHDYPRGGGAERQPFLIACRAATATGSQTDENGGA